MNRATELANLAMERRGYLVICWAPCFTPMGAAPAVGSSITEPALSDGESVDPPFLVVSETDAADAEAQVQLCGGDWGQVVSWPGARYFPVVAE